MSIQFILASRSPRRVEYLRNCGYHFDCQPADLPEEPAAGESPQRYAQRIALAKARAAVAMTAQSLPVLGADTDVAIDGEILGKPRDRDEGIAMLLRLSDRAHEVHSAVALVLGERVGTVATATEVQFTRLNADDAARYWDSGEPADKAGAYAIQGLGARFVRAIRGSFSGVVGLPLAETVALLNDFGIAPHSDR